jgi:hypothetical protein
VRGSQNVVDGSCLRFIVCNTLLANVGPYVLDRLSSAGGVCGMMHGALSKCVENHHLPDPP